MAFQKTRHAIYWSSRCCFWDRYEQYAKRNLHPQHQHVGDYTEAFSSMLPNIEVVRLDEPEQIFDSYKKSYERQDGKSTILVEWGDYYNEK